MESRNYLQINHIIHCVFVLATVPSALSWIIQDRPNKLSNWKTELEADTTWLNILKKISLLIYVIYILVDIIVQNILYVPKNVQF